MLQLFTTRTYQDRVDEIYKLLEADTLPDLED